jgi:lipopolysaccharide transport system ATP-binding protein
MKHAAITAEHLSKRYDIGAVQRGYGTLRDSFSQVAASSARAARMVLTQGRLPKNRRKDEFWALRDVSFQVERGEVLGIIGRNGAGKSTLLKVLSRITEPTEGRAEIRGRVGSLLEVGTGFHPELTGRENVFLNGAILGMRKQEILSKFDEIVEFAEVAKFVDTPVKRYSSGMYLRLAFAIAAFLEPEILLMDEVLAVGDAVFQKKCLGKMGDVARSGRTVLFVSHNMTAIRDLCTRAIWIDGGHVAADGDVNAVSRDYLRCATGEGFRYESAAGLTIESVRLKTHLGTCSLQYEPCSDLVVEVAYSARNDLQHCYVCLLVEGVAGSCFSASMMLDGARLPVRPGPGIFRCKFANVPLIPQTYTVRMMIRGADGVNNLVPMQDVAYFDVIGDLESCGLRGDYRTRADRSVSVMIPYEWTTDDGSVFSFSLKQPTAAEWEETRGKSRPAYIAVGSENR